jgi:nucleotide-binding universal stress UspA family protein
MELKNPQVEKERDMSLQEIVVGIDGSPASDAALRWAASEAACRGKRLRVLHAYDWRHAGARFVAGPPVQAAAEALAQGIVDSGITEVRSLTPQVEVVGGPALGQTGHVLIRASSDAALMVVGSRGRGGFASLLLGSVSHQVASHSHCPVVVVRGRPEPGGPVVVGVDGSPAGDRALGIAFEYARAHQCGLLGVRVVASVASAWGTGVPVYSGEADERMAAERIILADALAPWRDKFPDVEVEAVAADGHTAEVLTGLSATARLLIVGTRGHGGFSGLLLGSVSQQLLHHAQCPVMIAHSPEAEVAELAPQVAS